MNSTSTNTNCFLCDNKIDGIEGIDSIIITTRDEAQKNSYILFQILDIPHVVVNDIKKIKKINYCHQCKNTILNIQNLLEDLEEREKLVLHQKYLIEQKIKETYINYQHNLNSNHHHHTPLEKLKAEIVNELRFRSIQSMMTKIKNKQIGRKFTLRGKNIKIMEKGTTTPKILGTRNVVGRNLEHRTLLTPKSKYGFTKSFNGTKPNSNQELPIPPSKELLQSKHFDSNAEVTYSLPSNNNTQEPETLTPCCFFNDEEVNSDIQQHSNEIVDPLTSRVIEIDGSVSENTFQNNSIVRVNHHQHIDCVDSIPMDVNNLTNIPKLEYFSEPESSDMLQNSEVVPEFKSFLCGICGVGFDNYNQLEEHDLSSHSHLNIIPNPNCQNNIIKQLQTHPHPHLHPPPKVNLTRNNNDVVVNKRIRKYKSESKKCEECGKILSTGRTLKNHMMTVHLQQSRFNCILCNFGFQLKSNLKIHMERTHSDQRNFYCKICNKTYKCSIDLKKHIKTHTGEIRYSCKLCKIEFHNRKLLREHKIEIHSWNSSSTC